MSATGETMRSHEVAQWKVHIEVWEEYTSELCAMSESSALGSQTLSLQARPGAHVVARSRAGPRDVQTNHQRFSPLCVANLGICLRLLSHAKHPSWRHRPWWNSVTDEVWRPVSAGASPSSANPAGEVDNAMRESALLTVRASA